MNNEEILKSNTVYSYVTSFLGNQQFIAPVLIIYYTNYIGLNLTQYLFLDSILFLVVAIFEIPSGYVSDKFGRKKVLLVSQFMMLLSFILPIISKNFFSALISILVLGISSSLASGNVQSILFETLKDDFKTVISKSSSICFIMSMIASFISGFIFKINMLLPMILDIICLTISIFITLKFLYDDEAYKINVLKSNNNRILKYTNKIKYSSSIRNMFFIFIINGLIFSIFRTSYTFYQPIFEGINIPIEYFGIIFSLFNMFSFIGSFVYNKINSLINNELSVVNFFAISLLISVLGIYYFSNYSVLFFILSQQVIRGIYTPCFRYYTNYYIPENTTKRATYLSVNSLISTIITSFSLSASSLFNVLFNTKESLLRINIILIVMLSIFNYLNFYYKKKGDIECYLNQ